MKLKNIKSSNAYMQIKTLLTIAIPYLYIICLIVMNMLYPKTITYSVKYVNTVFYLQEALYVFLGILSVIYAAFIKRLQKLKLFALINIFILCCLIALPYINYEMFKLIFNVQNVILFFIGFNLCFLIKSIIPKKADG